MTKTNWQKCPYRKVLKGDAHCAIAIKDGSSENATDIVEVETCTECNIPDVLESHHCENLSFGKFLYMTKYSGGMRDIRVGGEPSDCRANVPDFKTDFTFCTKGCPMYSPIRPDDLMLDVTRLFDPLRLKTDSDIRQAILATLYRYHSLNPKRFGKFDVTAEYLIASIGISEQTLARVILPMEDNDEIRLSRLEGDSFFCGATITAKGIERIDSNPLFKSLTTEAIRSEANYTIHLEGSGNVVAVGPNATATNQTTIELDQLKAVIGALMTAIDELPDDIHKREAKKYVEIAEIETQKPSPSHHVIKAHLIKIKDEILPTMANIAQIIQSIVPFLQ